MGAQIAQAVHAAGAGGVAAPLALLAAVVILVGQPPLGILRHHGPDLADGAGGHQILGVLGGDMAGVGVGHHEQPFLFRRQLLQLRGLGVGDGDGLVAGDVDAHVQKRLADLKMGDVGSHHHHKVDAVGAGGLLLCHLPVVGIAPGGVQPQRFRRFAGFFGMGGKDAGHQFGRAVQGDGPPMGIADEGTGAAAHHSVAQNLFHAHMLLSDFPTYAETALGPVPPSLPSL